MMGVLGYVAARLAEPSTWAGLSALLVAAHVNIPDGVMSSVTLAGTGLAGLLALLMAERSGPPKT